MTKNAPALSTPVEVEFNRNSHHARIYFPQGFLPSNEHFQVSPDPEPTLIHECRPGKSNPNSEPEPDVSPDAAPFPGHSIFQESFFVCTIKGFADVPSIRDIYVETVVDANCGLAFAKVYPSRSPMNAVDILRERVFPFYERYAVTVWKITTRSTREYCGLAPVHPFETLLSASHVEHASIDSRWGTHHRPCGDFYHILCAEFFTPAIRNNSYMSFRKLQQDLDAFFEKYNHDRPYSDRSSKKFTPLALFTDAIGLSIAGKEVVNDCSRGL